MVNREIKARKRAVKEEKEEIDGEIVRIRKGHPRTNLPVELPENPTWLKICSDQMKLRQEIWLLPAEINIQPTQSIF